MIRINLRSGNFTKQQLDEKLNTYFDSQHDIDLFIEAMVQTGQITKKRTRYYLQTTSQKKYSKPRYTSFPTYSYAGKNRIGVRAGKNWIDSYGYPTDMHITSITRNGERVPIEERPSLKLVKGRYSDTIEAWRAEIPKEIRQKYNITKDTPINVRIDTTTYQYLTSLKLWGYKYRVMVSYGETKLLQNVRNLEIDGRSFIDKTNRNISNSISKHQKQIKRIITTLLMNGDPEYYGLYLKSDNDGKTSENIEAVPLSRKTSMIPIVELRDLQNTRTILNWQTIKEKVELPETNEFTMSSSIDQGRKQSRKNSKYNRRWSNKGGFL